MKINAINAEFSLNSNNEIEKMLGKDDFLKLLITELNNQNPLNPVDNKDFIVQLTQFSSLEQIQNINKNIDDIIKLLHIYQMNFALNIIDRRIVSTDENGQTIEGIVKNIDFSENNLKLILDNDKKVLLKNIIKIY